MVSITPLPVSFYERPVLSVAPDLLGCLLIRRFRSTTVIGRIVEVEAYRQDDPASHSYRGMTARNRVMFGPPGRLYVYFTYGMHFCGNVVTGPEGKGEAVLLRAVEPLVGLEHMARRRYGSSRLPDPHDLRDLTRGPARLCEAFHITARDNGTPLDSEKIRIVSDPDFGRVSFERTPRIGIRSAVAATWRYTVRRSPWISGRRSRSR